MTSLFQGHMLERYPGVRFGFFEAGGCGWVPYWTERLDEQIAARSKQDTPASEYIRQGRLFFSCEPDEQGLGDVVAAVGDGSIMYASDYPHGESHFPDSVSLVLDWPMSTERKRKLLWDNAVRFYARAPP